MPLAQCRATDSMIPAAQVQAMATNKTAPVKANCAVVPQIPSGRANTKANPTAIAPTWALQTRRALRSAQQGPTMSRPIKMIRDPRTVSAAAISDMSTRLSRQIALEAHVRLPPMARGRVLAGPKSVRSSCSPSDAMTSLGSRPPDMHLYTTYCGPFMQFSTAGSRAFTPHSRTAPPRTLHVLCNYLVHTKTIVYATGLMTFPCRTNGPTLRCRKAGLARLTCSGRSSLLLRRRSRVGKTEQDSGSEAVRESVTDTR